VVRTRYDDGEFSGGSLERPALQDLIADIRAGRIDIVVVYKVDRLTRSLADFARLVELFDAEAVSFVSVTQQFNTTSSMGRLTLNVLLSFAQFEREVTGERIRDKIAASKKKGMWMGGNVPLGYDASGRALVVNPAEAETVRRRIETRCRLIEEHELRRMDQRRSELHSARPTAGERGRGAVGPRHEIEVAHRCLGRRARVPRPVDRSAEPQIFENRELGIERQPLRHVTNTLVDVCGLTLKNEPQYMPAPTIRLQDPRKHAKRGGLAGAIGADETADLARPQDQRNACDRGRAAIAFRNIVDSHQQLSAARWHRRDLRALVGEVSHGSN
jgi:DNA invertase Pin-like site-specific DNA recombinase